MAEWYYVGHYGQLGPLTRDQIDELIVAGVISRETYMWRTGMTDWVPASSILEIQSVFDSFQPVVAPPPPPTSPLHRAETAPAAPPSGSTFHQPYGTFSPSAYASLTPAGYGYPAIRSDRSRLVAGILQILLPGVGRMYLGYVAIGVLQLIILIPTCFIGWLWSIIDGVLILSGFTKLDGYGRVLES
ncbi:MAG: membrane protein [Chthonomonadaceae bacterium]|uniref:TM2 domain-containing protein n=1 Tax=Candidatus Nitrosymbiomonas proteolyticus TaxID=2608984 RepID=A0A809RXV7_9BACT|nr:TM2 domain-containing protein [Candidatus Nitrosymbiomonas proteolyticus]